MTTVNIYWQDLTEEMQKKLLYVFGDNCNWDVVPIASAEIETDRNILIDSFLGDKIEEVRRK